MNFTEKWCPFEHTNVSNEQTKDISPVYACFPPVPPLMEIQILCPNNSTVYYSNQEMKYHLKRKCQSNGKWETQQGNCGCFTQLK